MENLIRNKTNNVKVKSLNGCDAIRETHDEYDTLTVKYKPIESAKPKTNWKYFFHIVY